MLDENQQQNPDPVPTPTENQNSEPNPAPVSPDEPTAEAPVPPIESVSPLEPAGPTKASPNLESAVPVNNDISANEPLESTSEPPNILNQPSPEAPAVTVEKHGTDTTITEVMEQPETPTAQMAQPSPEATAGKQETAHLGANEPLVKQREENLKLANQTRQDKKRNKINAILDLFAKQTNLTNDEVEKLLHVSDATATRYLETLEKEGKIKQVGKTGKHTHYEKI